MTVTAELKVKIEDTEGRERMEIRRRATYSKKKILLGLAAWGGSFSARPCTHDVQNYGRRDPSGSSLGMTMLVASSLRERYIHLIAGVNEHRKRVRKALLLAASFTEGSSARLETPRRGSALLV